MKKSGTVVIVGRPSVGKSTFLNVACREYVAVTSSVPQTTRDAIRGVVNTSLGQIVFVDTPGYHNSDKKLNIRLRSVTESQVRDSDALLYIMDAARPLGEEEIETASMVSAYANRCVVAVNKTDAPNAQVEQVHAFVSSHLPSLPVERVFDISSKNDTGIDDVLRALYALLPEGEAMYADDTYTDQDIKFRIAEIIRGEAINRLTQELPHCIYVSVADVEERGKDHSTLWARSFIYVERESQKGILIGSGASMIKQIRHAAIAKCRQVFERKVDLDIQVKVDKNWRQNDEVLNKIIR